MDADQIHIGNKEAEKRIRSGGDHHFSPSWKDGNAMTKESWYKEQISEMMSLALDYSN
jgi:hypothetical protein